MKPRIYVAGSSKEIELCRSWMRRLELAGYEIARDWPAIIDAHGGVANPTEGDMLNVARENLLGVQRADVFWFLLPRESTTIGAWIELGWAFARRRFTGAPRIVMRGDSPRRTVFSADVDTCLETHQQAFEYIAEYGRDLQAAWSGSPA